MAPATRFTDLTTPDGLSLAIREGGHPDGRPILFLHGWSQSSAVFRHQFVGSLAERFRLIAPDLRGHGASEKPSDPSGYAAGAGWAADLAAIIAGCGLDKPLVVGWSMGGWILGDYLRVHGPDRLGGLVLVGSLARVGKAADPALLAKRKADARAEGMYDPDPVTQIEAAITFAKAMTTAPLSKRDLAFLTAQMMACPPAIRRAARLRDEDWREAFATASSIPRLVIQGVADRVCYPEMGAETAAALQTEIQLFPGAGHMPFWEQPEAFDAAVAGLMGP
ncbi:MAG: alpha/beta hydrolase [Pseudomonadota bacterium]